VVQEYFGISFQLQLLKVNGEFISMLLVQVVLQAILLPFLDHKLLKQPQQQHIHNNQLLLNSVQVLQAL